MHMRRTVLLLLATTLTACNTMGPTAVAGARSAYGDALAQTQSEQMLRNLVRLRYLDMPMFLEVTSVNTQYELRGSMDASITGVFDDPLTDASGRFGTGVSMVERPTVTYAPLQGDAFVKRLMSPLGLDNLSLMVRSGWRLEQVLVICCQSLGAAANAPRATGPAQDAEIDNAEFLRLAALLGEVSRAQGGRLVSNGDGGYTMQFDIENPKTLAWLDAMGIAPRSEIPVIHGVSFAPDVIRIQTRSLLGAMFYLSLGIDVPAEHVASGEAPMPANENYRDITKDFFTIRSSRTKPARTYIKTRYRGHWFYIDRTDHRSKATFALLRLLFSLQSGSRPAYQPAVTIPLN